MTETYDDLPLLAGVKPFELGKDFLWGDTFRDLLDRNRRAVHFEAMRARIPHGVQYDADIEPFIQAVKESQMPIETLPFSEDSFSANESADWVLFQALYEIAVPLLKAQYEQEIEDWDWDDIEKACQTNFEFAGEEEERRGTCFLGTVFDLYPSGKYWHAIAAGNVDDDEQLADIAYQEALEAVAEKHGGWIDSGEGDPCDVFFGKWID